MFILLNHFSFLTIFYFLGNLSVKIVYFFILCEDIYYEALSNFCIERSISNVIIIAIITETMTTGIVVSVPIFYLLAISISKYLYLKSFLESFSLP